MVFWKGKEEGKEKLEVKGGQGELLPIFSYMSRPSSPRVATEWCSSAHGSACDGHEMRATACTTLTCVRPRFLVRPSARGHEEVEGLS